jgi:DNA-binding NtrC family response regulator
MPKEKILIIDDEADFRETLKSILSKKYSPILASNGKEGLNILEEETISLVLLDLRMPKMDGIEVLKKIPTSEIPVIIVTASKDIKNAVEAMKLGASDYITKPLEVEELLTIVKKALENRKLVKENLYLKEALKETYQYCDLIGKSLAIKKIMELIDSIAKTDSTVLIMGESGTGKEIAAKAVHKMSLRKDAPFIAINCAAIPDSLLESELFGHERGAFTGALERKPGKFELAEGGTVFLDEIGCMPPQMQAKLLRILEDKKIERIGGKAPFQVNVRIISATNIDFADAINKKEFRADLYYRLNVIPINLPALRNRKEDIPLFVSYFIDKFNKLLNKKIKNVSKGAEEILLSYDYPGNVRELQNLIERAVALSKGDILTERDFAFLPKKKTCDEPEEKVISIEFPLHQAIDAFEKEYIENTLRIAKNQTVAAKMLGIARTTLYSKMEALGVNYEEV